MKTGLFLSSHPYPHRVAYTEWGRPDSAHAVVCAHGLSRNGRDFDYLAEQLGYTCRVICPDMPGRGRSEWLQNKADYGYPLYQSDTRQLLQRLGLVPGGSWLHRLLARIRGRRASVLDWVGTSMGGILGMLFAADKASPIRRLVLNDVGPLIPSTAIARIGQYVGNDPHFADLADVERYLREIYAPFGPLTEEQWEHLALHGARPLPQGGYALAYDPEIAEPFRHATPGDIDLWTVWDAIRCPVLVLRGAHSDLLLKETAEEMTRRGPRARVVEIPDAGHAPALMAPEQIALVKDFLLG